MFRTPAVAGNFYPASPQTLERQVEGLLEKAPSRVKAIGVLVPHAGYVYSGGVAGRVYSRIIVPEVVVLLGPNHTGVGPDISVFVEGTWQMPSGEVAVETDLARSFLNLARTAREDYRAHHDEHSLEVQIPFLQRFRPDLAIVPITMMTTRLEACREVGGALAGAVAAYPKKVLLVASSDMTHYESDGSARKKDRKAIEKILELDPEGLHAAIRQWGISMCGFAPTVAMLFAAKSLGAVAADLVDYRTSGEVSGDFDQVVGYAGVVIR